MCYNKNFTEDYAHILLVISFDITCLWVEGNQLLDCDADWGQGVLQAAKHTANQELYCAPSDHMIGSQI